MICTTCRHVMTQEYRNGKDVTVIHTCRLVGCKQVVQLVKCSGWEDIAVPDTVDSVVVDSLAQSESETQVEKKPRGNPNWRKK